MSSSSSSNPLIVIMKKMLLVVTILLLCVFTTNNNINNCFFVDAAFDIPANGPSFSYANQPAFFQDLNLILTPGTFTTTNPVTSGCGITLTSITQAGKVNITGTMGSGCFIRLVRCTFVTLNIHVRFEDGNFQSFIELDGLTGSGNGQDFTLKIANTAVPTYLHRLTIKDSTFRRTMSGTTTSDPETRCTYNSVHGNQHLPAVCIQATQINTPCSSTTTTFDSTTNSNVGNLDNAPKLEIIDSTIETSGFNSNFYYTEALYLAPSQWHSDPVTPDCTCYNITIIGSTITIRNDNLGNAAALSLARAFSTVIIPQFLRIDNSDIETHDAQNSFGIYITNGFTGSVSDVAPQHPLVYQITRSRFLGIHPTTSGSNGAYGLYFFISKISKLMIQRMELADNYFESRGSGSTSASFFALTNLYAPPDNRGVFTMKHNEFKVLCGATCNFGSCIGRIPVNNTEYVLIEDNTCDYKMEGGNAAAVLLVNHLNVNRFHFRKNLIDIGPASSTTLTATGSVYTIFLQDSVSNSSELLFLNNTILNGGAGSTAVLCTSNLVSIASQTNQYTIDRIVIFGNTFTSIWSNAPFLIQRLAFLSLNFNFRVYNASYNTFTSGSPMISLLASVSAIQFGAQEHNYDNVDLLYISHNVFNIGGHASSGAMLLISGNAGKSNFTAKDFVFSRNTILYTNEYGKLGRATMQVMQISGFSQVAPRYNLATIQSFEANNNNITSTLVEYKSNIGMTKTVIDIRDRTYVQDSFKMNDNYCVTHNPLGYDNHSRIHLGQFLNNFTVRTFEVQRNYLMHDAGDNVFIFAMFQPSNITMIGGAPIKLTHNTIIVNADFGSAVASIFFSSGLTGVHAPESSVHLEHNILRVTSPASYAELMGSTPVDGGIFLYQIYDSLLKNLYIRNNTMINSGPRQVEVAVGLNFFPKDYGAEGGVNTIFGDFLIEDNHFAGPIESIADVQVETRGRFVMQNNVVELTVVNVIDSYCDIHNFPFRYRHFVRLRTSPIRNTILITHNKISLDVTENVLLLGENVTKHPSSSECFGLYPEGGGGFSFVMATFFSYEPWIGVNSTNTSVRIDGSNDDARLIMTKNSFNVTGYRNSLLGNAAFLMFDTLDDGIIIENPKTRGNNNSNNIINRFEITDNIAQWSFSQNFSILYSPNASTSFQLPPGNAFLVRNNSITVDQQQVPKLASLLMAASMSPVIFENNSMMFTNQLHNLQGSIPSSSSSSNNNNNNNESPPPSLSHLCLFCGNLKNASRFMMENTIADDNNNNQTNLTFINNIVSGGSVSTPSFFKFGGSSSSTSETDDANENGSSSSYHRRMNLHFTGNAIQTSSPSSLSVSERVLGKKTESSSFSSLSSSSITDLKMATGTSEIIAVIGAPCNRIAVSGSNDKFLTTKLFTSLSESGGITATGDDSCLSFTKSISHTQPPPPPPTPTRTHTPTQEVITTTTITNASTTTTTNEPTTSTTVQSTTNASVTASSSSDNETSSLAPTPAPPSNRPKTVTRSVSKSASHSIKPPPIRVGLSAEEEQVQEDLSRTVNSFATAIAAPTASLAAMRANAVFMMISCSKRKSSDVVQMIAGWTLAPVMVISIFIGVILFSLVFAFFLGLHNEHLRRNKVLDEEREQAQFDQEMLLGGGGGASMMKTMSSPNKKKNSTARNNRISSGDEAMLFAGAAVANNGNNSSGAYYEDMNRRPQLGANEDEQDEPSFLAGALTLSPFPAILIKTFAVILPWWAVASGMLVASKDPGNMALGLVPLILMVAAAVYVAYYLYSTISSKNGPRVVRSLAYRPPGAGGWTQSVVSLFLSSFGRFMISGWYTWQAPKTDRIEELMLLKSSKNNNTGSNNHNNIEDAFMGDLRDRLEKETKQRKNGANLLIKYRAVLTKFWGPHLDSEIEDLKNEATTDFGVDVSSMMNDNHGNNNNNTKKKFAMQGSGLNDLHELTEVVASGNNNNNNNDHENNVDNEQQEKDPGAPTGFCSNFGNPDFSSTLFIYRSMLCPHFILISSLFSIIVGILQGIATSNGDEAKCKQSMIGICVLNVICWILTLFLRPYIVSFKNFIIIAVDTVIAAASIIAVIFVNGGDEMLYANLDLIISVQYACSLSATIGGLLLVLLTIIKFFLMRVFGMGMVPRVEIIRKAAEELKRISMISPRFANNNNKQPQNQNQQPFSPTAPSAATLVSNNNNHNHHQNSRRHSNKNNHRTHEEQQVDDYFDDDQQDHDLLLGSPPTSGHRHRQERQSRNSSSPRHNHEEANPKSSSSRKKSSSSSKPRESKNNRNGKKTVEPIMAVADERKKSSSSRNGKTETVKEEKPKKKALPNGNAKLSELFKL